MNRVNRGRAGASASSSPPPLPMNDPTRDQRSHDHATFCNTIFIIIIDRPKVERLTDNTRFKLLL